MIVILVTLVPLIVDAQDSSTSEKLNGTFWKGTVEVRLDSGDIMNATFTYTFIGFGAKESDESGVAKVSKVFQISGYETHQHLKDKGDGRGYQYYDEREFNLTKEVYVIEESCTYEQSGKSIRFKCKQQLSNASIKGEHIEGAISLKPLSEETPILSLSFQKRSNLSGDKKSTRVKPFCDDCLVATGNLVKTEEGWQPANGYRWIDADDLDDLRVERVP